MNNFSEMLKSEHIGLVLPIGDDDKLSQYVAMHSRDKQSVENRPFRRKVDFWAFSIAIATALSLEPLKGTVSSWGKTFIYSSQGILNDELSSLLAVLTIAKFGHEDPDVHTPRKIIDHANRLAGAGCPHVLNGIETQNFSTSVLDRVLEYAKTRQARLQPAISLLTPAN